MPKLLYIIYLSLITYSTNIFTEPYNTALNVTAEYREADLSMTLNTRGIQPTLKSNIHFTDIHLLQLGVGWQDSPTGCYYSRGQASLGFILDGNYDESLKEIRNYYGYCSNIHKNIGAKARNLVDGRYVSDLSFGIGIPFQFCVCSLSVMPMIGYSYNEINLRVQSNKDLYYEGEGSHASECKGSSETRGIKFRRNPCCEYKFIQRWWGPWIGLDAVYGGVDCLRLEGQFEFHFPTFKGIRMADNRVRDFDHFNRSTNNAEGYVFRFAAIQKIWGSIDFGVNLSYQNWEAHKSHIHNRLDIRTKWHVWGLGVSFAQEY